MSVDLFGEPIKATPVSKGTGVSNLLPKPVDTTKPVDITPRAFEWWRNAPDVTTLWHKD